MRLVRILKSDLIIKGHGNYAYFGGQPHLLTVPPPEAFGAGQHENGEKVDAPAFAHFGNFRPHRDGHPGMGELVPGRIGRGKHGEMVYSDGQFDHHHGHDGVWHAVGEALEKAGLLGQRHPKFGELTPQNILQQAIDLHNDRHYSADPSHRVPDVDSHEWRQIHLSPYTGRQPGKRPNRTNEGKFITAFTNRPNPKERIGSFLESYSIPYNNELQEIMLKELGLNEYENVEWLGNNYSSIDDLHPAGRRLKGRGGDVIGDDFSLPESHLQNAPGGVAHDRMHSVHAHEVAHHLPDKFHYNMTTQQTKPKPAMNRAHSIISDAMTRLDPRTMKDVMVPVQNDEDTLHKPTYTNLPLHVALSDEYRDRFLTGLSRTPAFQFLFGRVKAGGSRPTPAARVMNHLLETFGGDNFDERTSHIGAAPGLRLADGSNPLRGQGTNTAAAKFFTKVGLAAESGNDGNAMRNHKTDTQTRQALGLSDMSGETVPQRRQGIEALANFISEAHGHETQRPHPENIPTTGLASRIVQGYPEQLIEGIPAHIPFSTDIGMLPVTQQSHMPARAPEPSPAAPSLPMQPVVSPSPVAPPPRAAPAQIGVRQPRMLPPGVLSPEQQTARATVGRMDPAQLRQFAQATGLGPRVMGEGAQLSPEEQRFQQAFGDPRQRLITEYMKSQDATLPQADRLMKAMEQMQRDDALRDATVMKHALVRPANVGDEHAVRHLAKQLNITPVDVRSIAHQGGDWARIAKRLDISTDVVKVVKVSIGGV